MGTYFLTARKSKRSSWTPDLNVKKTTARDHMTIAVLVLGAHGAARVTDAKAADHRHGDNLTVRAIRGTKILHPFRLVLSAYETKQQGIDLYGII